MKKRKKTFKANDFRKNDENGIQGKNGEEVGQKMSKREKEKWKENEYTQKNKTGNADLITDNEKNRKNKER